MSISHLNFHIIGWELFDLPETEDWVSEEEMWQEFGEKQKTLCKLKNRHRDDNGSLTFMCIPRLSYIFLP